MAIAVNKNLESGLSCIIPDLLPFLFAGKDVPARLQSLLPFHGPGFLTLHAPGFAIKLAL